MVILFRPQYVDAMLSQAYCHELLNFYPQDHRVVYDASKNKEKLTIQEVFCFDIRTRLP